MGVQYPHLWKPLDNEPKWSKQLFLDEDLFLWANLQISMMGSWTSLRQHQHKLWGWSWDDWMMFNAIYSRWIIMTSRHVVTGMMVSRGNDSNLALFQLLFLLVNYWKSARLNAVANQPKVLCHDPFQSNSCDRTITMSYSSTIHPVIFSISWFLESLMDSNTVSYMISCKFHTDSILITMNYQIDSCNFATFHGFTIY